MSNETFKKIVLFLTQSSENPEKTSATLTGALIMIATYTHNWFDFIPAVHNFFLSPWGQSVNDVATGLGFIGGGIVMLFGLYRKLTNKIESGVIEG